MKKPLIREMLLAAPKGQIDDNLQDIIAEFDDDPSATQILKALDHATHYASTSEFTISILDILFNAKSKEEQDLAYKFANENWRKQI